MKEEYTAVQTTNEDTGEFTTHIVRTDADGGTIVLDVRPEYDEGGALAEETLDSAKWYVVALNAAVDAA